MWHPVTDNGMDIIHIFKLVSEKSCLKSGYDIQQL